MVDTIYFAKIDEDSDAKIPTKEEENGGRDIYACFDKGCFIIEPFTSELIPTGIASAFSDNYVMLLRERGSSGVRNIKVNAGVIDSGYRGEIFVLIYNANDKPLIITKDKDFCNPDYIVYSYYKGICQAIMVEVPKLKEEKIPYAELFKMESKRGIGKLGASGK